MATKFRKGFLESEEGLAARVVFQDMTTSESYITAPSYSTDNVKYPDNLRPFSDKHMDYLNFHPQLDIDKYIVNIKMMCRV